MIKKYCKDLRKQTEGKYKMYLQEFQEDDEGGHGPKSKRDNDKTSNGRIITVENLDDSDDISKERQ